MSLTDALVRTVGAEINALTLYPDFGGVFDVHVDDEQIWSKDEIGEFPENDAMIAAVRQRLAG